MNTYIQLRAEVRQGVFEHTIVMVDFNDYRSISEAVLNLVEDMYEQGYSEFNREYYYNIDFDSLFKDGSLVVNGNLYINLLYSIGE